MVVYHKYTDTRKYPDILCPFCKEKGKNGVMRARIFETAIGSEIRYVCLDGCVIVINEVEVKPEMLVQNNKLFA